MPRVVCGSGVDIVEIERVKRLWLRHRQRLSTRIYTPLELEYCLSRGNPAASLAVRFAAKEAVMKALRLGLGGCRWRDIEVVREPGRAPGVRLAGAAGERAAELKVTSWHLSLSHCRSYAVAYALAERGTIVESS